MKRFFVELFCLFALCFIIIKADSEIIRRTPGDEIWSQCANITTTVFSYDVKIDNACIKLTEAENCGVAINLNIAGLPILSQRLDLNIATRACGSYNLNQNGISVACNVCVALRNDPSNINQQCVTVEPTCQIPGIQNPVPLEPYNAGCFGNDKLINVENCRNGNCPVVNNAVCDNHGTCASGKCACDSGWFGGDCSYSTKIFEQCRRVDQLSGDVCTRLIFENCNLKLQIVLVSGSIQVPLTERSYPVKSLNTVFQQDVCIDNNGCSVCLKWSNLVLTSTTAGGCGILSFYCGGIPLSSYPLGCFNDTQIVPACFGTCTNDCSGHGTCNLGTCSCSRGWKGDDCSTQDLVCPKNCGGKGKCNNGVCSCISGYTGADCSELISHKSSSSTTSSSFNPAFVIAPLVLVVGVVAIGVVVWYLKKKRDAQPRFNKFDLLEEEQDSSLTQELTESN